MSSTQSTSSFGNDNTDHMTWLPSKEYESANFQIYSIDGNQTTFYNLSRIFELA